MEKIIDRIEAIAKAEERSIRAFELAIGVSSSYINSTRKNKGKVGAHVVLKIIDKYPKYNLVWIMTGKGDKIHQEEALNIKTEDSNPKDLLLNKKIEDLGYIVNRRFEDLEALLKKIVVGVDTTNKTLSKDLTEMIKSIGLLQIEVDEMKDQN